jgi:hypothetical protein
METLEGLETQIAYFDTRAPAPAHARGRAHEQNMSPAFQAFQVRRKPPFLLSVRVSGGLPIRKPYFNLTPHRIRCRSRGGMRSHLKPSFSID